MRHVLLLMCAFALAGGALAGCADRPASRAVGGRVPPPPRSEFLLVAGDSTFWVTTGSEGVHVRGAPLVLARYGGRFYEVYIADEDRSFYNAVFVGQRIYARDLVNGDSVAVFEDSAVSVAAARYASRHPDDTPLGPDDDAADEPASTVTGEVEIIDLHGPYLSFEYRRSANGEAGAGEAVRHGVLDLRSHGAASLRAVLGDRGAEHVLAAGRRAFVAVRDSARALRDMDDEGIRRAAHALSGGAFAFDPASFTLLDRNRTLAVAFVVPGHGVSAGGRWLGLSPVPVSDVPGWWAEVRPTLPSGDGGAGLWRKAPVDVIARYDTADDDVRVVLRDSARHEWPVARVPAPTHRVYWLDPAPGDTTTRRALLRAFDESALYADDARSVRSPVGPHRAFAHVTVAAFHRRAHPKPRRGPDR
jgi:hypothetical protein